jgi:prepilin-type N-terminal cleavage/methylation domain-containing protein
MKRQSGFTILEILVAVGIVGILSATAVPVYRTWQGRAYGSEASIMLKQIMGAEINYFLENDKFFPEDNVYIIPHEGQPQPTDIDVIKEIYENLHITISQGHFLEYGLSGGLDEEGKQEFVLTIRSRNRDFEIFKGYREIWATLDKDGNSNIYYIE